MQVKHKDLRVFVVCGGTSSERDISINSGKAVYYALIDYGYSNVSIFYLEKDNLHKLIDQKPDVVYLALHGKGGEDGSIQGALELAGIKYTGPRIAASAICIDKVLTKAILKANNIPTPNFDVFFCDEICESEDKVLKITKKYGFPVVIKAPDQGSSIGVYIVKNQEELRDALNEVKRYSKKVLVEEFISGKEVTLPILGNDKICILPEIEIVSTNEFYNFESKYTKGLSQHIIPARISSEDREKLKSIGEKTYQVLGCKGISRIDFLIHPEKGPMVLEVNTAPGMTGTSLFPDSASRYGMSFSELVNKIIELALQ